MTLDALLALIAAQSAEAIARDPEGQAAQRARLIERHLSSLRCPGLDPATLGDLGSIEMLVRRIAARTSGHGG